MQYLRNKKTGRIHTIGCADLSSQAVGDLELCFGEPPADSKMYNVLTGSALSKVLRAAINHRTHEERIGILQVLLSEFDYLERFSALTKKDYQDMKVIFKKKIVPILNPGEVQNVEDQIDNFAADHDFADDPKPGNN